MSTTDPLTIYRQLLRPPVLHILRAAGFTRARPAVLETIIDLTSRYLTILAYNAARHARSREADYGTLPASDPSLAPPPIISITDVRMALQDVGALYPQTSELEENLQTGQKREEDLRGVNNFIGWCEGDVNAEIRRVAGMMAEADSAAAAAATTTSTAAPNTAVAKPPGGTSSSQQQQQQQHDQRSGAPRSSSMPRGTNVADPSETLPNDTQPALPEDYLTSLKKKHSKTGEESRWQGTLLGKEAPPGRTITIEGWETVGSLNGWGKWARSRKTGERGAGTDKIIEDDGEEMDGGVGGSESSSPLSDLGGSGSGEETGFG